MFSGTAQFSHQVCQVSVSPVPLLVRVTMVDKNKAVSELRNSLCERRLERTVLRPALLPVKNAQFWQAIAQASELSFPVVFHTENFEVHSGNSTFSSVYLPTSRWHHLKKTHRTDNKTDKHDGKPVMCQRTFSSVFAQFFTQLNCTV